jgi:ribonuclease E
LVPSAETLGIGFLRKLSLETLKEKAHRVKGIVPVDVAEYLLNKKRRELVDLEVRRDLSVEIEGSRSMVPGDSEIIFRE